MERDTRDEPNVLDGLCQSIQSSHRFRYHGYPFPHNVRMGRPWLNKLKACSSTFHQVLRFPIPYGMREIRGNLGQSKKVDIISAA